MSDDPERRRQSDPLDDDYETETISPEEYAELVASGRLQPIRPPAARPAMTIDEANALVARRERRSQR